MNEERKTLPELMAQIIDERLIGQSLHFEVVFDRYLQGEGSISINGITIKGLTSEQAYRLADAVETMREEQIIAIGEIT